MIGTMADILLKKPVYKEQMEKFLVEIVFPEFASPHGHLRYYSVGQKYCCFIFGSYWSSVTIRTRILLFILSVFLVSGINCFQCSVGFMYFSFLSMQLLMLSCLMECCESGWIRNFFLDPDPKLFVSIRIQTKI